MDNMNTGIIPINTQGTVAPNNVDVLVQVLQKLMEGNKPKANLSDATPDQQAAAQETANMKAKDNKKSDAGSKGANIAGGAEDKAGGLLPNLIDELFGASKGTEDGSKKEINSGKSAEQYQGGLTSLMKSIKGEGDGKKGTVSAAMNFIKLLG